MDHFKLSYLVFSRNMTLDSDKCFTINREHSWEEELVVGELLELQRKGLVKAMDHGAYTRIVQHDIDVQVC